MNINWKVIATQLAEALKRTPYYECGELDHSCRNKEFYHENTEECPIVKQCKEALDEYNKAVKK